MPKAILLFLLILNPSLTLLFSQTCRDASVEISAEVQSNPPRITLNWTPNSSGMGHVVHRKLKAASTWGTAVGQLPANATQFVDSTVSVGVSYEYRITRTAVGWQGFGYVNSGIEVIASEDRGTIVLVVDNVLIDSLEAEITLLISDLKGDGWKVARINVARDADVKEVKALIVAQYQLTPAGQKGVFLLGHVPVPYSGQTNPDGHPDHLGAWPADGYYGDVNGSWTDLVINTTVATDPRNHNVPEDGKFDQLTLPSDLEMFVGRVDFFNMPAFASSEITLMRNYLKKNHEYRHKVFAPSYKMLIDDNFGFFGTEAFAANGWKCTPLVGQGNVIEGDYFPDQTGNSYLWSYGCGGGWYTGAGGVGATENFAASSLTSVFTMLFGSYFGDWDTQNNFLRAPLAQGLTLTNAWAGRPHWVFHHMGLGEPIGYSARISQNNSNLYFSSYGGRGTHMALMGDPTLRNHIVAPPTNVVAVAEDGEATLTWQASPDPVLGYYVFRKENDTEGYVALFPGLITDLIFTDPCVIRPGTYTYMVRALILQESPSGTYYNLSQGVFSTIVNTTDLEVEAFATWEIIGSSVSFVNGSANATSYEWIFGDGQTSNEADPVHVFDDGDHFVTLIASNACDADTVTFEISISTATEETAGHLIQYIYPNPSDGKFTVASNDISNGIVTVYDVVGSAVHSEELSDDREVDLSAQPNGVYMIEIISGEKRIVNRLIIHHE